MGLFDNFGSQFGKGAPGMMPNGGGAGWGGALSIIGAALKDMSTGGQTDNVAHAQNSLMGQQQYFQQMQMRQQLAQAMQQPGMAGAAAPAPPVSNQMQAFSPDMAKGFSPPPPNTDALKAMLMQATVAGVDPSPYLDIITKLAPKQMTPYETAQLTRNSANDQTKKTEADYATLDAGSNDIAKAMAPSDLSLGSSAPGLSWLQRQKAFGDEQLKKQQDSPAGKAEAAAAEAKARLPFQQQLADERNAATEQRLADAAKIDLADPGDKSYIESIANYKVRPPSSGRNPAQRKAIIEAALQLNPDYTEAKFDQSAKALRDFGTGKQGDIARSLDVSVAHLDTLRDLGDALNNGNVTLVNAAKQRFAEEFGVPAPTNFDAAKAIVADEVAKGVIGGQTAQADRETLAASLRRSGSPQVIEGAINTFQSLLKGQLGGLRKQYERTTGAKDFENSFLSERTRQVLGGTGEKSPATGGKPDAEGWTVMPNGARVRVKK